MDHKHAIIITKKPEETLFILQDPNITVHTDKELTKCDDEEITFTIECTADSIGYVVAFAILPEKPYYLRVFVIGAQPRWESTTQQSNTYYTTEKRITYNGSYYIMVGKNAVCIKEEDKYSMPREDRSFSPEKQKELDTPLAMTYEKELEKLREISMFDIRYSYYTLINEEERMRISMCIEQWAMDDNIYGPLAEVKRSHADSTPIVANFYGKNYTDISLGRYALYKGIKDGKLYVIMMNLSNFSESFLTYPEFITTEIDHIIVDFVGIANVDSLILENEDRRIGDEAMIIFPCMDSKRPELSIISNIKRTLFDYAKRNRFPSYKMKDDNNQDVKFFFDPGKIINFTDSRFPTYNLFGLSYFENSFAAQAKITSQAAYGKLICCIAKVEDTCELDLDTVEVVDEGVKATLVYMGKLYLYKGDLLDTSDPFKIRVLTSG